MFRDRRDIIAIPTFNRVRHLLAFSKSLRELSGVNRYRIFIRDDASCEFDAREIASLFPQADSVVRNDRNLGPDASQVRLFRDCIEAGARRIIILDSDMLLSPSFLEFTERVFDRTDGFLGLYNSTMHAVKREMDGELVEKSSAGGTATCWDAGLLDRALAQSSDEGASGWDAPAVAALVAMGKRVLVSRRSYAQHLGFMGTNNGVFGHIDYGRDFVIETEDQARFMAETLNDMMSRQSQFLWPERGPRITRLRKLLKWGEQ
ncbi:glycosyltransferase [Oricola sp.]|uniref:glycosyltransferase family 2 protein n=1 Tax=Oricola sp. TaxID=1979950 RepID=UPI0025E334C3|nr:glycosyltransferase [Oricola sp.]MCI5073605.1 glycosyltransferase [Oricola sp.]